MRNHSVSALIMLIPYGTICDTHAATLAEADLALKSGDAPRAAMLAKEVAKDAMISPADRARAGLILALAEQKSGNLKSAESILKTLVETAGVPEAEARQASLLRVALTKTPRETRESGSDFLRRRPTGPDAAQVRIKVASAITALSGPAAAADWLHDRPASEKNLPYDADCADLETKLRRAVAESLRDDDQATTLDSAKRLIGRGDFAGALKILAPVESGNRSTTVKWSAFRLKIEALEGSGDRDAANRACVIAPVGTNWETAPEDILATTARLRLESGDTVAAAGFATIAHKRIKPENPLSEDLRWLLARAAARRGADYSVVEEALAGSDALRDCPYAPGTREHLVSQLLAYSAAPEKWMTENIGHPVPETTPEIRAADECFASGRYAEAARLHARLAGGRTTPLRVRAYATLQHARSLALLKKYDEAAAVYRRFLVEKPLFASDFAPVALVRAGVMYAGPMDKPLAALPFYEAAFRLYPETDDGDRAAVYRAHLLLNFAPARFQAAVDDYLKRKPGGKSADYLRKLSITQKSAKK